MGEEIAVVKPYYAVEEAYNMGYSKFSGTDTDESGRVDLAPYHSTADYANNVLPRLRAMAGYADAGHGTYQEHRKVAAVDAGCEEDEPAEAELREASHIFNSLVDAFNNGAYDAIEGREKSVPDILV